MAVSNNQRRLFNAVAHDFTRYALEGLAKTQQQTVISGVTTARTLTAKDSGSLFLFDAAAGIVYTLPAPEVGIYFDFIVTTTITSNSATVNTSAAGIFLGGSLISIDTDSANVNVGFVANGTSHVTCAQNGTTTGGRAGTVMRFVCTTATLWTVSGTVLGSGVVATPFA